MEWININVASLQSLEFVTADLDQRAAWITIMGHCVLAENGGRLRGARSWNDRTWASMFQLSAQILAKNCGLWSWKDDDLILHFYPRKQQSTHQSRSEKGRINALKRWENERKLREQNGASKSMPDPMGQPMGHPLGLPLGDPMRNGMECNGREGKGSARARGDTSPPSPDPDSSAQIPSIAEVRTWAMGPAGVDPDWAQRKAEYLTNTHGWVRNGRLIKWQRMFKADFERDRAEGKWPRPCQNQNSVKSAAPGPREDWMIEKELRAYQVQLEEHPMSHAAMGQEFTEEEKATYRTLSERIKALKRERLAAAKGAQ